MSAMFTNRVGDFFLTIGFFVIFFTFGILDYATVFSLFSNIIQLTIKYKLLIILRHKNICVKHINYNIGNSQITKAHNYYLYNYINNNFFNSFSTLWQYFLYLHNMKMSEK